MKSFGFVCQDISNSSKLFLNLGYIILSMQKMTEKRSSLGIVDNNFGYRHVLPTFGLQRAVYIHHLNARLLLTPLSDNYIIHIHS